MKNRQTYSTYDLGCAAALITAGIDLIELDRTDIKRVGFTFDYSYELKSVLNSFWGYELQVDARTYFDNTKNLKTRIFSE